MRSYTTLWDVTTARIQLAGLRLQVEVELRRPTGGLDHRIGIEVEAVRFPRMRSLLAVSTLALALAGASLAASLPGTKTAHDRAAWRALLHWPTGCENGWRATGTSGSGIDTTSAGASGRLLSVQCFPGAYQGDAMFYLVKSATQTTGPLQFQIYEDPGNGHPQLRKTTNILGVVDFALETGTLTVFDKYAGPGQCGIYSKYHLDVDHFVLTEARARSNCSMASPGAPQTWPKLPVPKG